MARSWWRKVLAVVGVLLVVYGGLCAYYYRGFCQEPQEIAALLDGTPMPMFMLLPFISMWNSARGGALEVGTPAPDFTLPLEADDGTVTLSSFSGDRPVVLVFGSYT